MLTTESVATWTI